MVYKTKADIHGRACPRRAMASSPSWSRMSMCGVWFALLGGHPYHKYTIHIHTNICSSLACDVTLAANMLAADILALLAREWATFQGCQCMF